ncbi:carboxylesterase family protein [Promicromonospora sp. Populi]|uniref:carboxylesterase family protein n=1 Tax=Promicromonospora sp. Populi TaxID=3239420 RepID=UPI0034E2BE6C
MTNLGRTMTGKMRKILLAAALFGVAAATSIPVTAAADTATSPAVTATANCNIPAPFSGTPLATSVGGSNNNTSWVLRPSVNDPKIQCGANAITLRTDVTYATVPGAGGQPRALKLDIQTPATGGPRPLVVYIPGGGFVFADKTGNIGRRTYMAEQGYAVASIEYRTILDGATYVDGVSDVKAAIRFLRAHAAEYGINSSEVAVYGESAGGYLASMVGTTAGVTKFDTGDNLNQSSRVQAVVEWFGASDLSKVASDFDPATKGYFENSTDNALVKYVLGPNDPRRLLDVPAAVAAANPITYAGFGDAPFIHFHGSNDRVISPSQTVLLHNALLGKRVQTTRFVVQDAGHGHLVPNGDTSVPMWSTRVVMDPVMNFLQFQLG